MGVWIFLRTICKSQRQRDRCTSLGALREIVCVNIARCCFTIRDIYLLQKCKPFALELYCRVMITILYYCKYRYVERSVHFGCPDWVRPYNAVRRNLLAAIRKREAVTVVERRYQRMMTRSPLSFRSEARRTPGEVVPHESFPAPRRRRSTTLACKYKCARSATIIYSHAAVESIKC